tara:strand:+ start:11058 stop:11513 length:456 start_codon:yes stop_codon:yes gene_type:complete
MDIKSLIQELIVDEGKINEIYKDHLGYETLGVGHLVLETDKEYGQPVGTEVSDETVTDYLTTDIENICKDLDRNIPFWRDLDEERQRVVANMGFNLGINRLLQFEKFLNALENKDYDEAANQMMDSRWARQVGPRSERLKVRMLSGSKNFA